MLFSRQFDDNVFWLLFWVFSSGLLIFFMNKLIDAVENWRAKTGEKNLGV
jgi:hypothetical protein